MNDPKNDDPKIGTSDPVWPMPGTPEEGEFGSRGTAPSHDVPDAGDARGSRVRSGRAAPATTFPMPGTVEEAEFGADTKKD